MLDKITKAFDIMRGEVASLSQQVERLTKIREVVKHGRDGKDAPELEAIVTDVLSQIPTPKDGKDAPELEAIVTDVLSQIPTPKDGKDGRDAQQVSVSDVAAIVLAKIPKPADGKDGASVSEVATAVRAEIKDGKPGAPGKVGAPGPPGKPGRDGASITKVALKDNELSVWIDGQRKKVGSLDIPVPHAPFASGGGGFRKANPKAGDNAIYVASEADFPQQDDTTITLQEKRIYIPTASFATAKSFIVEDGASFDGRNTDSQVVTYSGSGAMFSDGGVDANFFIRDVTLDCPGGELFDFQPTTPGIKRFAAQNVSVSNCAKFGSFGSLALLELFNVGVSNGAQGISFVGSSINSLSIDKFGIISNDPTFTCIDFGACVFTNVLELTNVLSIGLAGGTGLKGLTNSGNLPAGRQAMVSGCEFIGVTPLDGLSPTDVRWEFANNTPVPDSKNTADAFLVAGPAIISVPASGVGDFFEIGAPGGGDAWSWSGDLASRFQLDADGRLTYIGEKTIDVALSATATIEKTGGGADEIEARIAINWVPGGTGLAKSRAITQNSQPTAVPLSALTTLNPGDDVRVIFANNSSTSNIIALVTSLNISGA